MTSRENQILSQATLVTSLGDFISLFAVLALLQKSSGSVAVASYSIAVKSFAIALGGFVLPRALSYFSAKKIIVASQFTSFLLIALLAALAFGKVSAVILLAILFFETVLKQLFEGARETYSRSLGSSAEQRSLQAQILHGLFSAQTLGPVISFFLIRYLPIQIPLILDALSFLYATVIALQLTHNPHENNLRFSILRPISYLRTSPGLRRIFLLRSVGYWIPVGIFNYLLFSVIEDHYGLSIVSSAWVYASIGLGSMAATLMLRDSKIKWAQRIRNIPDAKLAALALTALAVTRIGFLKLPSLTIALIVIFAGGLCNGLNAVTTQSLRRKLTTAEQFPEIVGLELVVGKLADWAVATAMFASISSGWITYQAGIWISAVILLILANLHLNEGLLNQ